MEKRTKRVLAGLLAFSLFISLGFLVSIIGAVISLADTEPLEESFTHTVTYRFELETTDTLENASFLLPFPQNQGFSRGFNKETQNTTELVSDFNATVELVRLNNTTMLELESDLIQPAVSRQGTNQPLSFEYEKIYNRSLNTSKGLEKEASIPVEKRSKLVESCDARECFESFTGAQVEYDTEKNTKVSLSLDLDGWNEWFSTSWNGNQYRQHFSTEYYNYSTREYRENLLTGEKSTKVKLTGKEAQGDGTYR